MRGKAAEMENRDWTERYREELIDFYRQGVRTRSYSDEEGEYARLILNKMKELGYEEAYIDRTGNVAGRVGDGDTVIHFDSHMDTVQVHDADQWSAPPLARRSSAVWFTDGVRRI